MGLLDSFGFLDEFRRMNARQVMDAVIFRYKNNVVSRSLSLSG